ncbi:hypothetical protein [Corynebacterium pelargi]|uniref:DUF7847 domain-containing protein n=1 Tax=Corynebacterium pelargi TaxID=1471400 RepID=A0A410W8E5_9CORY|nr:hypothetical protein [Corynebacterium pelargi]QAU52223.1 hypothetical protein CPELA_04720 [Corynebacterium pelargi]GGG69249.1 hypothetical protein GCM10007338_02460 [Corynebacterium pelargi]
MSEQNDRDKREGGEPQDDGFQPYPPVNHPEDQPQYGQQPPRYPQPGAHDGSNAYGAGDAANAAGQPGYGAHYGGGAHGDGSNQYDGYGNAGMNFQVHPDLETTMVQPVRDVSVWNPIKYGFKIVFKRANPWLIWGVALALLGFILPSVLSSFATGGAWDAASLQASAQESWQSQLLNLVFGIVVLLLGPILVAMAVAQVDGGPLGKERRVAQGNYAKTLFTSILVGIIEVVAIFVPVALLVFLAFVSGGEEFGVLQGLLVLAAVVVGIVIALLLAPISVLATYYAAEQGLGPVAAIKASWQQGRPHLWTLVGYSILNGLITGLLTLFTCGLGSIIAIPQAYNAAAYMYRQVSGGAVPDMR